MSRLDTLIPGEIKDSSLATLLKQLSSRPEVTRILEIGASSGAGSTEALVSGMKERGGDSQLFCLEVSDVRYSKLRDTYSASEFVHCFRCSSAAASEFASAESVAAYLASAAGATGVYSLPVVLGWRDADLEYVRGEGVDANGIELVKAQYGIKDFDLVLLDGGDFTGEADLRSVHGVKYLVLNEIDSIKNSGNHLRLKADLGYELMVENRELGESYSVFARREPSKGPSVLDIIIPGEIKNDAFYDVLKSLVARPEVRTVLEIGSSAGGGSTDAFVSGIKERSAHADLYCMEVSATRFAQLRDTYRAYDFVHCYNVSSVPLSDFPTHEEVGSFYDGVQSGLRAYPRANVLGWLDADLEYVKGHGFDANGIELIKKERGIETFDLVLIDGSEFTGESELRYVYGARYIALDDINVYKNWTNYFRLKDDPNYELICEDRSVRNGFCVFQRVEKEKELPVHFLTIVLNGMPFIRYHFDMMLALPFEWHWHIVEGVADLKHDTAWSVRNGGSVSDEMHFMGRSLDGTTEYLDGLVATHPDKVSIYRKPAGAFWDGKVEMVNAPLVKIRRECLLWEIDADELWTADKIATARRLFLQDQSLSSAYYWCHFFVGQEIAVSTRNCYSQNPGVEWLRTWHYYPNCRWIAHEPPRLVTLLPDGHWADQGTTNPLRHNETEVAGLVFHHYAYATEAQIQFKESYYGYRNGVNGWKRLQSEVTFPCLLKEYFPWVGDETLVDKADRLGVAALSGTEWLFQNRDNSEKRPIVVVDSVFFQYYNTGIARVWRSLLSEWAKTEFGRQVVVLDRVGKAPRIPGLRYLDFPAHDYANLKLDQQRVQEACDYVNADLFISSYYSTPLTTHSVLLVYDMIPELLNADLTQPMWVEKKHAIERANQYICISKQTASDLVKFYPAIPAESVSVSHTGVSLRPPGLERVAAFKAKYGIERPYFLLTGARSSYKNGILFFKGFALFKECRDSLAVVCTGPRESLQSDFITLAGKASLHLLDLPDDELECAYAGAIALVYPSLYEGFGMPIIEAMACGCPVITCPSGPIPEVAGDAAIYVSPFDADEMHRALLQVQLPEVRSALLAKGLERVRMFSWQKMAGEMEAVVAKSLAPQP